MKWLTDVLERHGVIPSALVAEEIRSAFPIGAAERVLAESAGATLTMRGIRDSAGDLARDIGVRGARSLQTALELGDLDDEEADTRVVDLGDLG